MDGIATPAPVQNTNILRKRQPTEAGQEMDDKKENAASSFSSDSFFVVGHFAHCSPLQLPKAAHQLQHLQQQLQLQGGQRHFLHGHSPLIDRDSNADYAFHQPSLLVLDSASAGAAHRPHSFGHALGLGRPRLSSVSSARSAASTDSSLSHSHSHSHADSHADDWLRRVVESAGSIAAVQHQQEQEQQQQHHDHFDHSEDTEELFRRTPPLLLTASEDQSESSVNWNDSDHGDGDKGRAPRPRTTTTTTAATTCCCASDRTRRQRPSSISCRHRTGANNSVDSDDDDDMTPPATRSTVKNIASYSSSARPLGSPTSTPAVPIPGSSTCLVSKSTSSSVKSKRHVHFESSVNPLDQQQQQQQQLQPPKPFTSASWATEDCFHSPTRPELWGGGDNGGGPKIIPESFITFSNTYYGSVCNAQSMAGTPEDLFLKLEEKELRRLRTFTQQQQQKQQQLKMELLKNQAHLHRHHHHQQQQETTTTIASVVPRTMLEYVPGDVAAYKSILEKQKRGESIGCGGRLLGSQAGDALSQSLKESAKSWTPYSTTTTAATIMTNPTRDSAKDVGSMDLNENMSTHNQTTTLDQNSVLSSTTTTTNTHQPTIKPIIVKRMLVMGFDTSEDPLESSAPSAVETNRPPLIPLPSQQQQQQQQQQTRQQKRQQRRVQFASQVEIQSRSMSSTTAEEDYDDDEEGVFEVATAPLDGSSDTVKFREWKRRKRRAERLWRYHEIMAIDEDHNLNGSANSSTHLLGGSGGTAQMSYQSFEHSAPPLTNFRGLFVHDDEEEEDEKKTAFRKPKNNALRWSDDESSDSDSDDDY
ncbi:hypothetical protein BDR26DRAFT_914996 [Obelidium mucronatum]|nr:hypothetical protein BDR26DRAFT_914996 [Obelidium mucronatum]